MRRQGYGRIVNLASELGSLTNMENLYPAYRMSKTALICYTRVLANGLPRWGPGILVNAMCPGWVKTEMGGPNAIREIVDSADTALWLATLPDEARRGASSRTENLSLGEAAYEIWRESSLSFRSIWRSSGALGV